MGKQYIKGTQKVSKQALAAYYQQRPNTRWLGIPWKLWAYHLGQRSFDKEAIQQRIVNLEAEYASMIALAAGNEQRIQRLEKTRAKKLQARTKLLKKGNVLMRWGEAPVVYNPQQRALTEQNLLAYLQSKSYFKAHVSSVVKLRNQSASITYHIQENQPHLIGGFRLSTPDQAVEKLLKSAQQQSLLKKGAPYDQEVLEQERERIYELLSNHGYFNFDRQYIRFEVDTTAPNLVVIETVVGVPIDRQAHPVFHIDRVAWDVDADQPEEVSQGAATSYGGITFTNLSPQFTPQVLAKKLLLHPPQLYRRYDLIEMQQRLARLGIFKYINITYEVLDQGGLVPYIHTSPVDRFQLTSELGLQLSHGLPSPSYSLSLASKNLLGSLETLKLAAHVGVEGVAGAADEERFASSQALGIDLSLSWPQFLFPLQDRMQARLERFNPITKLSVGYDFTRRPEYTQDTFKGILSYTWQDQGAGTYEWIPLRMDLMDTRSISASFKQRLESLRAQENNLYRSFQPSWLSLFSFRSTFRKKSISVAGPSYSVLELFFESGGTLQNFIDLRKVMPKLAYYQYVKVNCSYSQHAPIGASTAFAYRLNTGIANPYGAYQVLPYNRYYFVGGANDMRAWAPRSLGPGTYSPLPSAAAKHHPEQPGEFLLQASVELRQRLVGLLEGALFVDAGNTWTLREDGRPGGKFSFQGFYKAIAVGAGMGVRLNLRFLVLRLDVGLKLYDPGRPLGERFIGPKLALNKHLGLPGQAAFNFGIGYPF